MSDQFSRRSVILAGAAGLATGTFVAAKEAQVSFSSEYWDCYRRRVDLERLLAIDSEETEEFYAVIKTADDAFRAAKEALVRHGVEGLLDIVSFLRVDYWHSGHFVFPREYVDQDHQRILRAVEELGGAEPWDVPDDLVRLVAEKDARESALRAVFEAERERRRGLLRVDIDDMKIVTCGSTTFDVRLERGHAIRKRKFGVNSVISSSAPLLLSLKRRPNPMSLVWSEHRLRPCS